MEVMLLWGFFFLYYLLKNQFLSELDRRSKYQRVQAQLLSVLFIKTVGKVIKCGLTKQIKSSSISAVIAKYQWEMSTITKPISMSIPIPIIMPIPIPAQIPVSIQIQIIISISIPIYRYYTNIIYNYNNIY